MKTKSISCILALSLLTGCVTYQVKPEKVTSYNNGIQVLTSAKPNSKVQIEVAQRKLKGLDNPPLVIYVGAQILSGGPLNFDTSNISASEGGNVLSVLSFQAMMKSSYDFEPVLQKFNIATPNSNIVEDGIGPSMFYYGQGSFLAYDMMFGMPFMMMDDVQTQEIMQEERQAFKIMAINYLKRSTLKPNGKAKGGFVVIDPKPIKPGTLVVKVNLHNEIHTFKIDIQSTQ
ncbi:hypothetical protein [Helicobacter ailurogastricus]|uniref:Putative n=1 Tax=Helicobacter ailurogastricus TaxID=1578720 RepID=A0A0K2Y6G8_9HELI|nr:hypothetical protein [Helicobacter ailurogastricus]CRF41612.1 putative [Helicobacter ailurogastricus]CRF42604.1 putative [Helicobacter ailurogastricus]CRF44132.1 putative [Helicobacter ailurogastricus]CRF52745.1 putative [Helicobacter ailurogastricus]BDQ28205.1 hypothetical protein ASB7_00420 [Helicobacter ailurogastricus]